MNMHMRTSTSPPPQEPTTGLDPETKRSMWTLVDLAKEGRAIVLTTHSMEEADALCGRIGIMAYGKLRCLGAHRASHHAAGNARSTPCSMPPLQVCPAASGHCVLNATESWDCT